MGGAWSPHAGTIMELAPLPVTTPPRKYNIHTEISRSYVTRQISSNQSFESHLRALRTGHTSSKSTQMGF